MNESEKPLEDKGETVKEDTQNIVERLSSAEFWLRLAYMLLFFVIVSVAAYVMTFVVIVQFFWVLIAGEKNNKVSQFSKSLSLFIYEILLFLSHNTDEKPFPFKDWPEN